MAEDGSSLEKKVVRKVKAAADRVDITWTQAVLVEVEPVKK